jgi:hypothetical protein
MEDLVYDMHFIVLSGYSHNSVVQPGHVMPQLPTATYTAGTGLQTQPELAIAYALPPNHSSGYLVHGKVTGEYRKSCTRQKAV